MCTFFMFNLHPQPPPPLACQGGGGRVVWPHHHYILSSLMRSTLLHHHHCHHKSFNNGIGKNYTNNPKQIFRICNSLLGRKKDSPLPPGFTNQELANNFNSFFITKITNIRNQLDTTAANISPSTMELVSTTSTLNTF